LAAALRSNDSVESTYRRLGAIIIDGRLPVVETANSILAAAAKDVPI
jgi:hypothetical protein